MEIPLWTEADKSYCLLLPLTCGLIKPSSHTAFVVSSFFFLSEAIKRRQNLAPILWLCSPHPGLSVAAQAHGCTASRSTTPTNKISHHRNIHTEETRDCTRYQLWNATKNQYGKPLKHHGVHQPSKKPQWQSSSKQTQDSKMDLRASQAGRHN